MNILIVSVDYHPLQLVETATDAPQLKARKLALRVFLQVRLKEDKIAAIFEEESQSKMTIASQLASQNDPAIPWRSINMTDDERREAGIYDALCNRPELVDSSNMPPSRILVRIPADAVREDFFVNQILEANYSDGEVLVLLGNMHVMAVSEKLRSMGHTVDIRS